MNEVPRSTSPGGLTAPGTGVGQATRWWHDAVGYAVYLRSFCDSDGDGVGDLSGMISRLDHLEALGADLAWISPFYPSPMADFGYDVAEYCGVDPLYGDLDDFDRLLEHAGRRGIRIVVDLVPNHTSVDHEWFRLACQHPVGVHRQYYIWRDPGPHGGPPNNWVSYFGGPAWTFDEASGQYFLHLFLPSQPDLNWRNPAVHSEFEHILRFWLERGVAGFRIDVAQGLVKDAELRSNPQRHRFDPAADRQEQWDAFDHLHDVAQPETLAIFESWRGICAGYDAVLVGETHVDTARELAALVPGTGLDVGFWFGLMQVDWDPEALRVALRDPLTAMPDPRSVGWVASSLDEVRAASRLGGGDIGRRRSLALTTLLFCLPGVPFLYQGEELGLLQGFVPPDRRADPVGSDFSLSRDGCRTPIPWEPGPAFGFSSTVDTWLPDGGRTEADTASVQRGVSGSWFERYRALIQLRRNTPELRHGTVEWFDPPDPDIIGFRRGPFCVLLNAGHRPIEIRQRGSVQFDTHQSLVSSGDLVTLEPDQAVITRS